MRDSDWQIISVLYETRNITKTAELLFITQPTLTRRIQLIEEDLGTTLILRSNKGVSFTSDGQYIALKAREILQTLSEIREYISSQTDDKPKGTIRLGAPKSYVYFVIPDLLENFSKLYPGITFEIHTDLSHTLLSELEAKQLDISFVCGDIQTTLYKELLSEDQIFILSQKPFNPDNLPDMPRIEYAKEASVLDATDRWWKENFKTNPIIRFSVESGNACLQMVRRGLGYGIFSDSHYNDPALHLYSLPLIFQNGEKFTRPSWMVYDSADLKRSRILTCFVRYIHENYDKIWHLPDA
jgi:DNA-binding transcriptional LysR family regulator